MTFFQKLTLLATFAISPHLHAIASDTLSVSRDRCVEIALQDNPTVIVADMEIKKVNYAKKENLASLFPGIDFSLSYQRSIELQTIRMNMGGESQALKMGSDNNWNTGFSASMPLIAPTLWKSISISNTQILASLENSRASRLDLVNNVNKAYYALLLAIASQQVVKENHDIAVMNASIFEDNFKAGTASEYDVLRSAVQVKNLEPELLQADIAVKQCKLQLKVLMGISTDIEIIPDGTLRYYQENVAPYGNPSSISLAGNSSLRSLDIQKKILDKTVDLKKFAWLPTLSASFNLSWLSLSNGSPFKNQEFNPYCNVGVNISVPIFSGGSKYYGLKQAKIQRKEIEIQRDDLINNLNMQVQLAVDNINREASQIASSEEGMKQAQKAYSIMQKSFEIGEASYLDLRDSELANTTAHLSYFQAIYNYLVSSSELDTLLGKNID